MRSERLEIIGVVAFVASLLVLSAFAPSFTGQSPQAGNYQPTLTPASGIIDVGQSMTLVVTSISSSSLGGSSLGGSSLSGSSLSTSYITYWYLNGTYDSAISGAGMVSFTFSPAGAGVYTFYVELESIGSSSTGSSLGSSLGGSSLSGTSSPSNTVTIIVNPAPVPEINGQTSTTIVVSPSIATFTATASAKPGTGTGPFEFFWELSSTLNGFYLPSSATPGWTSSSTQIFTQALNVGSTYYVALYVEDMGVSGGNPSPLIPNIDAIGTLTSVATVPQYQVTVNAVNGTSTPSGTASYLDSYALSLTATGTSSSYVFTSWTTNNSLIRIENPLSLNTFAIIGGAGTITANFQVVLSSNTVHTTVSGNGNSTTTIGSTTVTTKGATPGSLTVTLSVLSTTTGATTKTPTGTSSMSMSSQVVVFDVVVTSSSTTGTVTISYTNPSVTSSTQMLYWNGQSWAYATDVTIVGTTISGVIPIAYLTGTPVMLGTVFVAPPPPVTTYTATFSETGLPSGAPWFVNVTGQPSSGAIVKSEYNVTLPAGNYSYSVSSGYKVSATNETFAPSVSTGTLVLEKAGIVVTVTFKPVTFPITFTESGLPTGTAWFLNVTNLNGVEQSFNSTSSAISFSEPNGTYSYAVASSNSQYGSQPGSFKVNGAAVSQSVTFTQAKYTVEFEESGLVSGTSWSVTLNGHLVSSTSSSVSFTEPNGAYSYSIGNVSGYVLPSQTGTVTVSSANVTVHVPYEKLQQVTVSESGLPSGTKWFVNVTNSAGVAQSYSSTSSTVSFQEINGTYSYTVATVDNEYSPSPSSGTVRVVGPTTLSITFSLVTYSATFTETGLPSGTSWSVTLNGVAKTSTTGSIVFTETNGTYQFSTSSTAGYRANTYSGSITVNGASVTTSIQWSLITYQVVISQTGIPSGTTWSVTLTGTTFNNQAVNTTQNSTSGQMTFSEPNGTYTYVVHLPSHYSGTNLTGSLSVAGSSLSAAITAKKIPTTNYTLYIVIVVVVVIIIALVAVLLLVMRRKK